eukprot:112466-Prymnesium_polylepis.3
MASLGVCDGDLCHCVTKRNRKQRHAGPNPPLSNSTHRTMPLRFRSTQGEIIAAGATEGRGETTSGDL